MKERPILFSGPMVRAILEGKKTQTRRVMKPQPKCPSLRFYVDSRQWRDGNGTFLKCPYGIPGDRLWVRETWATIKMYDEIAPSKIPLYDRPPAVYYKAWTGAAKYSNNRGRWRPSIHMPRWASRLTLEVADVKPERLQDITEDDIVAEGINLIKGKGWHNPVDNRCYPRAEWAFQYLWNSINAKRGFGWDVNLWVWVIEFGEA